MHSKFIFTLTIILFLFITTVKSQTVNLVVKATLPAILDESSGVEALDRNNIWSHNDSGGNPELYNFDSTGSLVKTLTIQNAINTDWEDLARDSAGNIYIGDFGNNNNNRQDLKIYKIPDPATISGNSVIPDVINFSYLDQTAFPPPDSLKNFDMEAIISFHDSLYLFSKNRTDPYNGYTKLYKLPQVAGTYIAELIDSFYTGPGSYLFYSVTAAGISPDNSRVILLAYDKCWLFTNFTDNHFFNGTVQQFTFSFFSQKEGICFITDDELYITDEFTNPIGKKLYYMNLQPFLSSIVLPVEDQGKIIIAPVPFADETVLTFENFSVQNFFALSVYDAWGKMIYSETIYPCCFSENKIILDDTIFKNADGVFIIELAGDKKIIRKKILRIRN